MSFDFDLILEDCLERLAQGQTLDACLAHYPGQAEELRPLLRAATRLQSEALPPPSAVFKAKAKRQLYAHMQSHPRQQHKVFFRFSPALQFVSGLAVLLLAFTMAGAALAQSALPGDKLYSWKLASEQAWRASSSDPIGVDLALAGRRIDESLAVSSDVVAQKIALHGYQLIVTNLESYQDANVQERIRTGLKVQKEKLKNAGISVPGEENTPSLHPPLKPAIAPTKRVPAEKTAATPTSPLSIPGLPLP